MVKVRVPCPVCVRYLPYIGGGGTGVGAPLRVRGGIPLVTLELVVFGSIGGPTLTFAFEFVDLFVPTPTIGLIIATLLVLSPTKSFLVPIASLTLVLTITPLLVPRRTLPLISASRVAFNPIRRPRLTARRLLTCILSPWLVTAA